MHFTADDDAQLIERIKEHRDQFHTDITDDGIRDMVSSSAYDE